MKKLAFLLALIAPPALGQTIYGTPPATTSTLGTVTTMHPGYVAGNWYTPFLYGAVTGSPSAPGANLIVCTFGTVQHAVHIDTLGVSVTTNDAGKHIQLAAYAPGSWGRPGALIAATGDITLAGTGNASGAASGTIPQGGVWLCLNTDSTLMAVRAFTTSTSGIQTSLLGSSTLTNVVSSSTITGISISQTYGTWPTFTSSTSWTDVVALDVPWVAFHVDAVQ